jgi:hypothetical protein
MNRATFFAAVRRDLFGGSLTQPQVAGMEAILDEWDRRKLTDLRWLAYPFATAFHEVARTMQPIHEYGTPERFRKLYDVTGDRPSLARRMGNTEPGDGVKYCGRGFVQLTWKNNYEAMSAPTGIDIVKYPDRAMELPVATTILFEGMIKGTFTGKDLADYFHGTTADWVNARRIINGLDKAQVIAGYGKAFHAALLAAA